MLFVKTPLFIQKLFPSILFKKETTLKQVYLTFDDGPTKEFTHWILKLLDSLNIRATFFCVGVNAEKNPNIISDILERGHRIGNHTYSHKNAFFSSTQSYFNDIIKCKEVLPETDLFRPPYGKLFPWQILKIQKYFKIIMWDVLSYDFKKNISTEKLKENVLDNLENGSIIVFHDNLKSEEILKECLQDILVTIKEKGYTFSTL